MFTFYSRLPVTASDKRLDGGHVTTMYSKTESIKRFQSARIGLDLSVTDVVHLPSGNVTVAIVDHPDIRAIHKYYRDHGLVYDHEFLPHITICNGSHVDEHVDLIGTRVLLSDELINIWS